jgi:hypothetical protein
VWSPHVRPHQRLPPPAVNNARRQCHSSLFNPLHSLPFLPRARAYKKASTFSPLPLFPSPDCAARPVKFLAVAPHICRRLRPILLSPVSPSSPPLLYPIRLVLAHLLKSSAHPILQPNDASIVGRRSSASEAPPAVPLSFHWKQSRTPFTLPRPP